MSSLQQAFAPRTTAHRPGFDIWFSVLQHPSRRLALWIRYTLLRTVAGDQQYTLWFSLFDGDRPGRCRGLAWPLEHDFLAAADDSIGLSARAMHADLLAADGRRLAWRLELQGAIGPFDPLPGWLTRLPVGGTRSAQLEPRVCAGGYLVVDDEHIALDAARGVYYHLWGHRLAHELYWVSVPAFDGEAGYSLELLAIRPDPTAPMLCVASLGTDDGMRVSGGMLSMLVSGVSVRYPRLTARIRGRGFEADLQAELEPARAACYRYRDPDGRVRHIEQDDLATVSVDLRQDGRRRLLRCAGRAALEFHRPTAWSDAEYLDPCASLFNADPG